MSKGGLLVLSGPSGAGKSTIIKNASSEIGNFYFSISCTTRAPREGEVHGREYFFLTKEEFEEDIKKGNFLEYALVHGHYYGTSMKPVFQALNEGKLVIFDIDVQGQRLLKERFGKKLVSCFITPPTLTILQERLYSRCSDDEATIKKRLTNAKEEIKALGEYDFLIINDDLKQATKEFIAIANAARNRYSLKELEAFQNEWFHG